MCRSIFRGCLHCGPSFFWCHAINVSACVSFSVLCEGAVHLLLVLVLVLVPTTCYNGQSECFNFEKSIFASMFCPMYGFKLVAGHLNF